MHDIITQKSHLPGHKFAHVTMLPTEVARHQMGYVAGARCSPLGMAQTQHPERGCLLQGPCPSAVALVVQMDSVASSLGSVDAGETWQPFEQMVGERLGWTSQKDHLS